MYYGTAVAGRTRSRLPFIEKQNLVNKKQSKEQNGGEEFGSDYASEEEGSSMDFDGAAHSGSENLCEPNVELDAIPVDDDDDVLFIEERDEGSRQGKGGKDDERRKSTGERNWIEFGFKRKKKYGLDILIDEHAIQERRCVAQRTRSQFSSKLGKIKLLGTFSHPLCLDEEEQDYESLCEQGVGTFSHPLYVDEEEQDSESHCEQGDSGEYSGSDEENFSGEKREGIECMKKAHKKGELGKPTRKRNIADPKDFDVIKILQDSFCGEGEVSLEKFASLNDEERNPKFTKTCLSLNFTFGIKDSKPPEKSEYEKELDAIWAEMDEYLRASERYSGPAAQRNLDFAYQQDENDNVHDPCPLDEVSTAALCHRGKHQLILDEEIGLRCAFCLHVALEIKYIVPPFSKNPWGKSDRRDSCTWDDVDHSVFNELQHGRDDCSGYDPSSSTGTVWDIIPGVKRSMYPHQCEAFEFLWRNLAGGIFLDELKEQLDFPGGSGCIISHAPGTGKTRLTIVFLQTYMSLYPTCRPIIIAPSKMLLTWGEEFDKWKVGIPFHNLNNPEYSGKESEVAMSLLRQSGCNVHSIKSIRMVKLYSWKKDRSILGISYRLFEKLAGQSSVDKDIRKALLELPGLLVLDEGHTPRNAQSLIWKALSEIRTKRRIILSGTPFQNNFDELYNTLCLVRPNFAEWNTSADRMVVDEKQGRRRNETRRNWAYLTKSYGKVSNGRERCKILKEIRDMINPFVHVHKGTILQENLPGLRELVVILKPTQLQKELLEHIQKPRKGQLQGNEGSSNLLKLEYLESLTAVHPSLFLVSEDKKLESLRLNPEDGVKMKFLMELIRLSELMNEKVLVFSQFIDPLTFLTDQLKSHFSWTEGREMLQMHGKIDLKVRQASMKAFNDPTSKVRVLLASTKACFEGINLVGASRVVLLDVVWNPSVERQAVSRAYRLGQKKVVYTYHLITSGTRDETKCCRQAEKDQLSELVFFCSNGAGHQQNISSADLEDKILEEMIQNENFRHVFEKIATNKQTLL